jgi:hypothetical protein
MTLSSIGQTSIQWFTSTESKVQRIKEEAALYTGKRMIPERSENLKNEKIY